MRILYFAWVRERIGIDQEELEVPEGVRTVSDLTDWLAGMSPRHAAGLAERSRLRVAVDQRYAAWDADVGSALEIAFFPPVTGG